MCAGCEELKPVKKTKAESTWEDGRSYQKQLDTERTQEESKKEELRIKKPMAFEQAIEPVSASDYNGMVKTMQATIESLGDQLQAMRQQRDELLAACNKALAQIDVRVQQASGGDSITEAEQILTAAIARAEKGAQ